ncbi:MAG: nitrophenyl compound nitroreductase subunit ArsF family protein [Phocaeicola sp.]
MKRILFILCVVAGLAACGSKKSSEPTTDAVLEDCVEVIYFHGKKRCITCNAIESLTKEVINEQFKEQAEAGAIVYKVVDISSKEGEKIADKYEVAFSSLYINKWKEGKESRNDMTKFGFSYAKGSPDQFKEGIQKKIEELLKP